MTDEEKQWLTREINRYVKERNALVLSHNYEIPDIQDVAKYKGDSIFLAQKGSESDADVIVEAAVLFMPQILAVMKKPHQIILAPSLNALCSLAAHADPNKIMDWKKDNPTGIVISYVNTYIEVKALSNYCCGSANAAKVIEHVAKTYPDSPLLFLPDVHLGFFAAKTLEEMGQSIDRLWLMMGACHVHNDIRPYHVDNARKQHPNAAIAVHPECGCTSSCMRQVQTGEIPLKLVGFRSTSGMFKYAEEIPQKEIIIATEVGNIYPLSKAVPSKTFIPANPDAVCAYMKQNTLRNLYESLRDMKYEITVDPELAKQARVPIERMLRIV
ncbi:MAG: hypothetical protein A3B86_00505 [Candidatus Yanofskybacteria bacterium RIFCSPHIGHO2_02_FULL_38_22b]|uniref:quinolinate synthase n=1 Tax=Candidatus Yanofskybacteria bacterium RIFCSPHIGHO2_02_FULL_38_22b TaxID=1802673 RepID=A0A1F8F397_9BACT|nr:MAG: hypothetical protein A2816_03760 [Candidatus Yanofskybacteria bacterium RIFCSPHIGHO2_01_FULL_39_44]OGN07612.1 MAG: hypothetical protein A3B86_00505 [Candidatus Yanofskybacteria bacterium RIFCSPHIGHO2_02_FULL_38_22b]OGN20241.1 MAG: hypothetical protein A2910_00040 [Candidatus Yanofskybacteria bacterium RIFCSPLOWO2_01_FULL_39_28]